MLSVPARDGLPQNHTNDSPIVILQRILSAAKDTVQPVAGSYSSRSSWAHQKLVIVVREKVSNQVRLGMSMKIESVMLQQLNALLLPSLDPEIKVSLDKARSSLMASMERKKGPDDREGSP